MDRRMDIYDVAHEWANRTESNASGTSSNLFFAGGCIYSYGDHFMIAKHVRNEKGEHAALFTERTYSKATSKHVSIVASASSHITKLYVPDPSLEKEEIFSKWHDTVIQLLHSLGMARKPAKYLSEVAHIMVKARRYADFFGYEIPENLAKAGEIRDNGEFCKYLAEERADREVREKKENKARLLRQRKQLKDWRNFKNNYVNPADGFDYLRYQTKTGNIETTQRVTFPLPAGHQLYQFVLASNAKGGCTDCKQSFLDRYPILEINKSFIVIGCHKVALKEINAFAKQRGWV